jgi:hypothetical protein
MPPNKTLRNQSTHTVPFGLEPSSCHKIGLSSEDTYLYKMSDLKGRHCKIWT